MTFNTFLIPTLYFITIPFNPSVQQFFDLLILFSFLRFLLYSLPSFPLFCSYFPSFLLPSSLTWNKHTPPLLNTFLFNFNVQCSIFSIFSTWWSECYCWSADVILAFQSRGTCFTVLSGGIDLASFSLLFTCVHWMLLRRSKLDLSNHGQSCWGSSWRGS